MAADGLSLSLSVDDGAAAGADDTAATPVRFWCSTTSGLEKCAAREIERKLERAGFLER